MSDPSKNPVFIETVDYPDHPDVIKLAEDIQFYSEKLNVPSEVLNNLVCTQRILSLVNTQISEAIFNAFLAIVSAS